MSERARKVWGKRELERVRKRERVRENERERDRERERDFRPSPCMHSA